MGIPETRLTMCDLHVTHFMCARNSLFNTMYWYVRVGFNTLQISTMLNIRLLMYKVLLMML
jgi:hypothetical protein